MLLFRANESEPTSPVPSVDKVYVILEGEVKRLVDDGFCMEEPLKPVGLEVTCKHVAEESALIHRLFACQAPRLWNLEGCLSASGSIKQWTPPTETIRHYTFQVRFDAQPVITVKPAPVEDSEKEVEALTEPVAQQVAEPEKLEQP